MSKRIDFTHAFKVSKQLIKQYNSNPVLGKDDKPMYCHSNVVHTFRYLVEMMSSSFNKYPKLYESGWFTTNNQAIGTYTDNTKRTIQTHLIILGLVGLIDKPRERWHGSSHGFEIALNERLYPAPVKAQNLPSLNHSKKIFPHKELETSNKLNNNYNVEKEFEQSNAKSSTAQTLKTLKSGNKRLSTGESSDAKSQQEKNSSSGLKRANFAPKPIEFFTKWIESLVTLCIIDLYTDARYMADSQLEIMRFYFYNQLKYCTNETEILKKREELSIRLFMVRGWLKKKPPFPQKKRFIPLPYIYFDSLSKSNFDRTSVWYEALQDQVKANEFFRKRRDQIIRKRDQFFFRYKKYNAAFLIPENYQYT